ncbi:MAG: N-6 DNA methylase [Pirellulales bacterium]|nr:N-6 DNA methylase [Pirellulales bacterium]
MTTVTEERAQHVRQAASLLVPHLENKKANDIFGDVFGSRWDCGHAGGSPEAHSLRSAWALVSMWLVGQLVGAIASNADYRDAEHWFLGSSDERLRSLAALIPNATASESLAELRQPRYDDGFAELLPYVLDTHGPGSRLSVMREPGTKVARSAKRRDGVFYTPADVAEYMAGEVLGDIRKKTKTPKCLDPSCGSGVFLRALLHTAELSSPSKHFDRFAFAQNSLYGFDISALAVEAACFVLLHDTYRDIAAAVPTPWVAWHLLRLNFSVVDSLSVTRKEVAQTKDLERRSLALRQLCSTPGLRDAQNMGLIRGKSKRFGSDNLDTLPIARIFPEAASGFDVLIGNPPYSALKNAPSHLHTAKQFVSFPDRPSGSEMIYSAFIEMMWRLTVQDSSASGLVVPLSIAYHQGKQLTACRLAIMQDIGHWRFAFFDREPHALFGEDVKTRNAILFRVVSRKKARSVNATRFQTGPLQKWTSRNRSGLFASLDFTPINVPDISRGIPKLDGQLQCQAAAILMERTDRFSHGWKKIRTCFPSDACSNDATPVVFIASTAYNFLNVFRPHNTCPALRVPMSENRLFRVEYASEKSACVAFAILSSRLVYWWWHVHGDGFHVARWLLESIPFCDSSFSKGDREKLAACGGRLWDQLQSHQVVSLNRNRVTIAYRPLACESERDEIDAILTRAAAVPQCFCTELRRFVHNVVVIDNNDERRQHVRSHFRQTESIHE